MIYYFVFRKELEDFHLCLKVDYQHLLASVNPLLIMSVESSVISGDCKQRPISFYLDDACQILHTWKLYQHALNSSLSLIKIKDSDSIRQFQSTINLPQELSSCIDRYLLFSTFLIANK